MGRIVVPVVAAVILNPYNENPLLTLRSSGPASAVGKFEFPAAV